MKTASTKHYNKLGVKWHQYSIKWVKDMYTQLKQMKCNWLLNIWNDSFSQSKRKSNMSCFSPAFKGNSSFYKWNSKLLAMSHQIPHVLVLLTSIISDHTTPPCLSCTDLLALPWTGLTLCCLRAFALLPLSVISHFRKKKVTSWGLARWSTG